MIHEAPGLQEIIISFITSIPTVITGRSGWMNCVNKTSCLKNRGLGTHTKYFFDRRRHGQREAQGIANLHVIRRALQ